MKRPFSQRYTVLQQFRRYWMLSCQMQYISFWFKCRLPDYLTWYFSVLESQYVECVHHKILKTPHKTKNFCVLCAHKNLTQHIFNVEHMKFLNHVRIPHIIIGGFKIYEIDVAITTIKKQKKINGNNYHGRWRQNFLFGNFSYTILKKEISLSIFRDNYSRWFFVFCGCYYNINFINFENPINWISNPITIIICWVLLKF